MAEYIDKEDLLELYDPCEILHMGLDPETEKVPFMVVRQNIIDMIPADVKPVVHGYWINEPDRYFHWHCSECGYVISGPHREFNYCPNCGTKMHGDR